MDAGKNSFAPQGKVTTINQANTSGYSASSVSVNVSAGNNTQMGGSAGMGSDSQHQNTITTAGITGFAGDKAKRTEDREQGIVNTFDAQKVQKEIDAQVKITQEFGKNASTFISNYASSRRADLQKQKNSANTEEEKARIEQEIKDINMQERALNILASALTGMAGSVITREALSTAAEKMRDLMIEDSKIFAGVVDSTGKVLSNVSGTSEGVRGDGVKAGGTRVDLDLLCGADNARCTFPKNSDGTIDTSKPLEFKGNLEEFLQTSEGQKMSGATGGIQGAKGTLFGVPYAAGSWQDKLVESFSGTHDFIGGKASGLYDEQGNIKRGMSPAEIAIYNKLVTTTAILPSIPFAAAEGIPPEVWKAIAILLGAGK